MGAEVWKSIKGFEGLYEVSNMCRVKSLTRMVRGSYGSQRPIEEKILRQYVRTDGYYTLMLSKESKNKRFVTHRLIAEAFIENSDGFPFVNHINGIKTDNRIENLEWCTGSGNMRHAYDIGLINRELLKENGMKASLKRRKIVEQYSLEGKLIAVFESHKTAGNKTNIFPSSISQCCSGKNKTAGGFVWKHTDIKTW